ncbi:PPC domain-containing protein [Limnoglobus roseus]|uniref:Peptidase n=1 Tax=Limnoglobus roseus TaxID=2598579 RepID=A0A5C1A607_9BACT|nr:PPC domain-containing protein [Limnoglobus roseus]QEL13416.1 peptidase [Limnoglobus roseus]
MRSRCFLLLLTFAGSTSFAIAGTPRVARVTPPGGQRGAVVTVELIGRNLDEPREVIFYESGITAEAVEKVETILAPNGKPAPVDPGTRVRVRMKVADDCPLGAHGLRLRTADGLSEYHRFFVGPFPTVEEDEQTNKARNDTRETAKAVPVNCTVFGRLNDPTDVDVYRLEFKKGHRISAEIESARLGTDRGIPDLHLAFYDAAGKKLAAADDSALFVQDPILSILAPTDGVYFVEVRHSVYNGTGEQYRLHVGTFVRPTGLYPAGGPAGSDLKVEVLGDPKGKSSRTVKLPKALGNFDFAPDDAPSPNRLRVSPFPNVLEAEPNDNPASLTSASIASLPVAFNGIIDKPGDVDCFVFRAKKGEQFRFHAMANCLGSPMDPAIWVKPLSAKNNGGMQRASDSRPNQLGVAPANGLNRDSHDPILEYTAPADGEYVLGVEDERGEGGSDYVYRVEVSPEANGIYTYIAPEPENQNAPQLRQAIVLAPGNRWTSQVAIFSTNRPFNGELEIVGVNLPKGVTVTAPKLTPGVTKVPVVFEAAADVKPQAALIDLVVRPAKGEATFVSGYRQTILMNGYGNNDYYMHVLIEKLALAVTEEAPFAVEVEEPKTSLVQNGEMLVNFKVKRQPGYTGPVTVLMDWKPTGINTATPVTVAGDKTEGTYLLGASRNATAGKQAVTLTAVSGGSGRRKRNDDTDRTYVASKLFSVTVAEPHVEARIPRTSIERGKTATITLKLNHLQKFDGKAKATLARLPRGVELVEPTKEITSADKEVSFTLKATTEALVGNYQGVTMDLTVIENGQPVRQLSGYGQLRIDAERGAKPGK